MGHVAITHVLGTIGLLTVFFSATTYFQLSFTSLQYQICVVQLDRAANYVASNIIEMISLCYVSDGDQLIVKELRAPTDVRGYSYSIELSVFAEDIAVRTFLTDRSTIGGESVLPWSTDANITVYDVENPEIENYIAAKYPSLDPRVRVFSRPDLVIWCWKTNNGIIVGLGVMSEGSV